MVGRDAMEADGLAVLPRGVTGVAVPAVVRHLHVEFAHVVVAVSLREDGGRGNGEVLAVALDDGLVGQLSVGLEAVAIDDDELRTHSELVEGTVHGEDGRVEDVDVVYLAGRHTGHGPRHSIALHLFAQGVAALGGELLGVVEPLVAVVGREDDGRGKHAAGETAAPGLVAARLYQSEVVEQR